MRHRASSIEEEFLIDKVEDLQSPDRPLVFLLSFNPIEDLTRGVFLGEIEEGRRQFAIEADESFLDVPERSQGFVRAEASLNV
jgi:hypothetical protein